MTDPAITFMAHQDVSRRFPDLDPKTGLGATRRWNRLMRLAEVCQEYRVAVEAGSKAPASVIATARGVEPGTVRTWLYQAKKEGFQTPAPRRANEIGAMGAGVAENLKRIRSAQRMTTDRLAERMTELGRPMYANTITKIEKLQRRIDVDDLVALATALSVTPVQLLEEPTGCGTCQGTPPPGFACNDCGAGAATPLPANAA